MVATHPPALRGDREIGVGRDTFIVRKSLNCYYFENEFSGRELGATNRREFFS